MEQPDCAILPMEAAKRGWARVRLLARVVRQRNAAWGPTNGDWTAAANGAANVLILRCVRAGDSGSTPPGGGQAPTVAVAVPIGSRGIPALGCAWLRLPGGDDRTDRNAHTALSALISTQGRLCTTAETADGVVVGLLHCWRYWHDHVFLIQPQTKHSWRRRCVTLSTTLDIGSSSDITAMETELYRTRRPLGGPWPMMQEQWEEHVHPFAQIEGPRGKSRWVPANSAPSRILASPIELDSLADDKWRQFEPPVKELALVEVGTPPEICRIIRESLENQLAARQRLLHGPWPTIQETETDHNPAFVNPAGGSAHPAPVTATSPSESQHTLQDSSSSSASASSGVRSNGSSVRNAGLTPSTSRSSNSSRATQNRDTKPPVQKGEVNAKRPFSFVPFFGALPTNNRLTGPHQVPPRVAQIKKFWNDRMSEGCVFPHCSSYD
jgi:hypothetical protein